MPLVLRHIGFPGQMKADTLGRKNDKGKGK